MPSQDYEEFIAALNAHGVRYLVVGAVTGGVSELTLLPEGMTVSLH